MYYLDEKFGYSLEECMFKHSEEWKKIFLNVLTVKIALLANSKRKMKLKEVDVQGMILDVVNEAIPVFDKFLYNNKGYKKVACIDEYDGSDVDQYEDIDYKIILAPFAGFFDGIEVK